MTTIPKLKSSDFTWSKRCGYSDITICSAARGNPPVIEILSVRTGEKIRLDYVFDEDGYDGEFRQYRNSERNVRAVIWNS